MEMYVIITYVAWYLFAGIYMLYQYPSTYY